MQRRIVFEVYIGHIIGISWSHKIDSWCQQNLFTAVNRFHHAALCAA